MWTLGYAKRSIVMRFRRKGSNVDVALGFNNHITSIKMLQKLWFSLDDKGVLGGSTIFIMQIRGHYHPGIIHFNKNLKYHQTYFSKIIITFDNAPYSHLNSDLPY